MNVLKVNLSSISLKYWIGVDYFSFDSDEKFQNYFFNELNIQVEKNNFEKNDGIIYNIQDENEFEKNKINIMLCVENCYFLETLQTF